MSLSFLRALLITDPLVIVVTSVLGTMDLCASFFDRSGNTQHVIARVWSRILLLIGGVRVTVTGGEHIDPARGYVFASNHLSFADTPVVLANIPVQFRFMAKHGLFQVPFIGFHLRRGGHIPVPREDPRAAVRAIHEAGRYIKERQISILVFPEGGRSNGELRPFKEGGAMIALAAQCQIVPCALVGTRKVLPMGSVHIRAATVELRIGKPISTEGMSTRDRGKLTAQVYKEIAGLLGEHFRTEPDPAIER